MRGVMPKLTHFAGYSSAVKPNSTAVPSKPRPVLSSFVPVVGSWMPLPPLST